MISVGGGLGGAAHRAGLRQVVERRPRTRAKDNNFIWPLLKMSRRRKQLGDELAAQAMSLIATMFRLFMRPSSPLMM